jgi:hypothetical protein
LATYNDYPDSNFSSAETLLQNAHVRYLETLTAMFHQMAQTVEVRSVAVDYLITQLIPKGLTPALDTLLGTRIVKVRGCELFSFAFQLSLNYTRPWNTMI